MNTCVHNLRIMETKIKLPLYVQIVRLLVLEREQETGWIVFISFSRGFGDGHNDFPSFSGDNFPAAISRGAMANQLPLILQDG